MVGGENNSMMTVNAGLETYDPYSGLETSCNAPSGSLDGMGPVEGKVEVSALPPAGSVDGMGAVEGKFTVVEQTLPAGALDGMGPTGMKNFAPIEKAPVSELFSAAEVDLMLDSAQSVFNPEGKSVVAVDGVAAGGEAARMEIPWEVYMDVRATVASSPIFELGELTNIDGIAMEVLSAHPEIVDGEIKKVEVEKVVAEDDFGGLGDEIDAEEASKEGEKAEKYLEQHRDQRRKMVREVIEELYPERAATFHADMDQYRQRVMAAEAAKRAAETSTADAYKDPFAEAAEKGAAKSSMPERVKLSFDVEKGIFVSRDAPLNEAVERAAGDIGLAEEAFGRSLRLSGFGDFTSDSALTDLLSGEKSASAEVREAVKTVEAAKGKGKAGRESRARVR